MAQRSSWVVGQKDGKSQKMEKSETLSSGHDMAVAVMNTQQLWLPAWMFVCAFTWFFLKNKNIENE